MFECGACDVRWRDNTSVCWCCGEAVGDKATTPINSGSGDMVAVAFAAIAAARQA
jgi:hypothetical protein